MGHDPVSRAGHRLLCGRLAGLLFLVGSLATVPVHQMWQPAVSDRVYAITGLGVFSGLVALLIPWDRLPARWLQLVPPVASIEVGITMWGVGRYAQAFMWFLVFVAIWSAYAFDDRRAIVLHLVTVVGFAWYPTILADSGAPRANVVAETLIAVPIMLVAAGVVAYLRERLTAAVTAIAHQARSDALTGVGNYRLLEERLEYEVTRHARNGRPLSVIVLDLDGFKEVNDTFGHPVGDRLLRQVASSLEETVRDQDTVVRQGGDEFCILAPETDADDARALIVRVKHELGRIVANGLPVSASAGAATFPQDATDAEVLLAQADLEQRQDKADARGRRGVLRAVR